MIKEPPTSPGEGNGRVVPRKRDVDVPELLGDEGLNALVLVDDKAEGGELAWS